MHAEYRESLLKKEEYYENCPGCKVDRLKQSQQGLPIRQLVSLWIIVLATSLPISSCFPFLYFMIRDFNIAEREEDIAYYAGFIGASFMCGRALTSIVWGMVADRYGRKPTIIVGTASVVVFNTFFGLSANLGMAVTARFLQGSFHGLIGPMRAYTSEIFQLEYQALGMSTISTAWGIGLIIGPALGGLLAQPAEKWPSIFSKESLFGRFPYFLPCMVITIYAMGATVVCFCLPETLHRHNEHKSSLVDTYDAVETAYHGHGIKAREEQEGEQEVQGGSKGEQGSKESLIRNWPLMSSIITYCIFSLHEMAYTEIFPIWAESPRQYGGLSCSTDDVGQVLSITGLSLFLYQLFLYQCIERTLGPINVIRIPGVLSILVLQCFPFLTEFSGFTLSLLLNCASAAKNVLSVSMMTGLLLLQNNAVDQNQRGAANGISMMAMSVFKAVGPAGAGVIFSWAQKRQNADFLPGEHMVFFLLNVILVVGLLMTFRPFLAQRGN